MSALGAYDIPTAWMTRWPSFHLIMISLSAVLKGHLRGAGLRRQSVLDLHLHIRPTYL